jgi:hypothetical protein
MSKRNDFLQAAALVLAASALSLGAAVLPTPVSAADAYTPAAAEPGTDIPAAEVKFGMRPYADNTFNLQRHLTSRGTLRVF